MAAGVELELDNYRTALTWALTEGNDALVGGAIAGALERLWTNAGLTVEGRYWTERALEGVSEAEQPRVVARLQLALCRLSSGKHMYDAAERAMRLYAAVGDARRGARAQQNLAFALFQMGEFDAAHTAIARALAAARACVDALSVAEALNVQASIEWTRGDVGAARERYAQALAACKALGNESGTAVVLGNVAELEFADGYPEPALRAVSEALEIHLRGKNATYIAGAYGNAAAYRIALDDLAGAHESAREGLRVARKARRELDIAIALQHLALLAGLGGESRRAAALLGYVDARYAELGLKREFTEQWGYDKLLVTVRETLREDELAPLLAEGATWSEDQAVEEALQAQTLK